MEEEKAKKSFLQSLECLRRSTQSLSLQRGAAQRLQTEEQPGLRLTPGPVTGAARGRDSRAPRRRARRTNVRTPRGPRALHLGSPINRAPWLGDRLDPHPTASGPGVPS